MRSCSADVRIRVVSSYKQYTGSTGHLGPLEKVGIVKKVYISKEVRLVFFRFRYGPGSDICGRVRNLCPETFVSKAFFKSRAIRFTCKNSLVVSVIISLSDK